MARASFLALIVVTCFSNPALAARPVDGTALFRGRDRAAPSMHDKILTLFLNRRGVTLTGGGGGSAENESRVLGKRGIERLHLPPYSGGAVAWETLYNCVKDAFAPYRLNIVDSRPARVPYIMAVVGGSSSLLGLNRNVTGVAPFRGRVMSNAVVFAFQRAGRTPTAECNTVAHEVGHALGLRHSFKEGEIMSYIPVNGRKSFLDASVPCGEYGPRRCSIYVSSQNSHSYLASTLGLSGAGKAPEPYRRPVPVRHEPAARVATAVPAPTPRPGPTPWSVPRATRIRTITARISWSSGGLTHKLTCSGSSTRALAMCLKHNGLILVMVRKADGRLGLTIRPYGAARPTSPTVASRVPFWAPRPRIARPHFMGRVAM